MSFAGTLWVTPENSLSKPMLIYIAVASLAPEAELLGRTPQDNALVDQWIHFIETEVDFYTVQIVALLTGRLSPYSKPIHEAYLKHQLRGLHTLDTHLGSRPFFVGERITLSDLFVASLVHRAARVTLDTPTRAKLPNLMRHIETILNHPALVSAGIFDGVPVLETAIKYVPPEKETKAQKESS